MTDTGHILGTCPRCDRAVGMVFRNGTPAAVEHHCTRPEPVDRSLCLSCQMRPCLCATYGSDQAE